MFSGTCPQKESITAKHQAMNNSWLTVAEVTLQEAGEAQRVIKRAVDVRFLHGATPDVSIRFLL